MGQFFSFVKNFFGTFPKQIEYFFSLPPLLISEKFVSGDIFSMFTPVKIKTKSHYEKFFRTHRSGINSLLFSRCPK